MEKVLNISYKLTTIILLVFVAVDCHMNVMKYSSFNTIYAEAIQTLIDSIKMKILLIFPSLAELDLVFIESNEFVQMILGIIMTFILIFEMFWNANHTHHCIVNNLLWCTFLLTSILENSWNVDPFITSLIKLYALITPKKRIELSPVSKFGVRCSDSSNESTSMVNNNNAYFTSRYDSLRAEIRHHSTISVNLIMSSKKYQTVEDTDTDIRRSSAPKMKTARNNPTIVLRQFTAYSNLVYPDPLYCSLSIGKMCYIYSWLAACQRWEVESCAPSSEESVSGDSLYTSDNEIPESVGCCDPPTF